jgi:putative hydrolase of the HAD superfamily
MDNSSNRKQLIAQISKSNKPIKPREIAIDPVIKPLNNIRAVLFDVYGTMLVCRTSKIALSLAKQKGLSLCFEHCGFTDINEHTVEQAAFLLARYVDWDHKTKQQKGIQYPEVDIREILERVLLQLRRERLLGGDINNEIIEKFAVEYECIFNPVYPMPGLEKTLELLQKQFYLGIISNAQFYTSLSLSAFKETRWSEDFKQDLCFWSWKYREAKPSFKLFDDAKQVLSKKYSIPVSQAVYIGNDMLNDILPAHKTGFKTILFAGDSNSLRLGAYETRLAGIKSDCVITSMPQLADCVQAKA